MPFIIGTKKIVPQAAKKKKESKASVDRKQNALHKRRKESEALLFGQELFEPISRKEKEIVIHFPEHHTNEGIYISKCGKFGYRRTNDGFSFDLFYFISPILEYKDELEIIPSDDAIWIFDNLNPDELEDLACRLKRAEYADERKRLLEEIKEIERQRREELDKADEEFEAEKEKEAEQLELIKEPIEAEYVGKDYATMDALLVEKLTKIFDDVNTSQPEVIDVKAKPVKSKSGFTPISFRKSDKL